MAKLKTRSGVALKPKVIRVKTGEPDAVSEAPVASPSCSYTPGSLTSFLQSAATVKLVESGKVIGGKNKKGESSSASASTQKCTADSFQPVAADLQKLRAFFEGVDKKPESAQNEALRAFDRNSISKGVSTAQRRKTVVDVLGEFWSRMPLHSSAHVCKGTAPNTDTLRKCCRRYIYIWHSC